MLDTYKMLDPKGFGGLFDSDYMIEKTKNDLLSSVHIDMSIAEFIDKIRLPEKRRISMNKFIPELIHINHPEIPIKDSKLLTLRDLEGIDKFYTRSYGFGPRVTNSFLTPLFLCGAKMGTHHTLRVIGNIPERTKLEAEKPLYTILSMMDNKAHQDGNIVCKISTKEFEAMLNSGRWNELIAKIKETADKEVINDASKGRYPLLGELFKSNHKDSTLAMTAFGLYKDKDGYSVRVNPEKLQYSNYEYFDKALQNIRLSQQITENVASQLDMNSENSQNVHLKR